MTSCDCLTKPSPTQGHTGRIVLMVARQPSKTTDSCVYRSRVFFLQMCVVCATVAIAISPPSLPQDMSIATHVSFLTFDSTNLVL